MPTGRDDEGLTWGENDPTLDDGSRRDSPDPDAVDEPVADAEPVVLPDGYTALGKGSDTVGGSVAPRSAEGPEDGSDADDADPGAPAMGSAELISLGVLGGFAVLYAVGWLIGGLRLQGTAEFLVAPLAYQVSLWLAVLAPPTWFATVLLLTRGRRSWVRFAWLVGGVALLVPWPFIMVGAIGR